MDFLQSSHPRGTPPDTVARFNREISEHLKGAEIQQRLISLGLATEGAGTPKSTARFIREEQGRWRDVAKELDIQPQ
jgi:tripartite-type tricarboxylate transporter receptor subunit TctC